MRSMTGSCNESCKSSCAIKVTFPQKAGKTAFVDPFVAFAPWFAPLTVARQRSRLRKLRLRFASLRMTRKTRYRYHFFAGRRRRRPLRGARQPFAPRTDGKGTARGSLASWGVFFSPESGIAPKVLTCIPTVCYNKIKFLLWETLAFAGRVSGDVQYFSKGENRL